MTSETLSSHSLMTKPTRIRIADILCRSQVTQMPTPTTQMPSTTTRCLTRSSVMPAKRNGWLPRSLNRHSDASRRSSTSSHPGRCPRYQADAQRDLESLWSCNQTNAVRLRLDLSPHNSTRARGNSSLTEVSLSLYRVSLSSTELGFKEVLHGGSYRNRTACR